MGPPVSITTPMPRVPPMPPPQKRFLWGSSLPPSQRRLRPQESRPPQRKPDVGPPPSRRLVDVESARAAAAARVRRRRREHRARWQQDLLEELAALDEPQAPEPFATPPSSTPRAALRHGSSRSTDIADRAAAAAGMRAAAAAAARARSYLDVARKRAAVFARQAEDKLRTATRDEGARAASCNARNAASGDDPPRRGPARSEEFRGLPPSREPPQSPPPPPRPSHYAVLGVQPRATAAELKKAFFALALRYHPDRSKLPQATALMMRINEAYSCLIDPRTRLLYDIANHPPSRGEGRDDP